MRRAQGTNVEQNRFVAMQHALQKHETTAPSSTTVWFEAIARRRCVSAIYNRTQITLAPHVLYLRADQPYVAGVVLERRGTCVEERRLGIFAVAGLREPVLKAQEFHVDSAYSSSDARWSETTLLGVDAPPDLVTSATTA